MSLLPEELPRLDEMQKVVELHVQNVGPYAIAKKLNIRKVDVDHHIEQWRASTVGSEIMKDRVEELIASMDQHYSMLIQKAYEVIDEVDAISDEEDNPSENQSRRNTRQTMTRSQMLSQKLSALKAIADFESKRIDVLQKSGLLEAADVGADLVEMEMKYEEVMTLLEENLCEKCTPKILGALSEKSGGITIANG